MKVAHKAVQRPWGASPQVIAPDPHAPRSLSVLIANNYDKIALLEEVR